MGSSCQVHIAFYQTYSPLCLLLLVRPASESIGEEFRVQRSKRASSLQVAELIGLYVLETAR